MFYVEKENKVVLFDETKQNLENTLKFMPHLKDFPIKETLEGFTVVDYEVVTVEEARNLELKNQAKKEIEELKSELQADDYKIIKIMEATISGTLKPYENADEIIAERNFKRARINELQAQYNM